MTIELRKYQTDSMVALYDHLRKHDNNPVIVLPTGGGKGVLLAKLAQDVVAWKGRLLILAHVKELLAQSAKNIEVMAPEIPIGIYSAGLGSKETEGPVIVAGIQSAYRNPEKLGHFDIVAVDEVHCVPPEGEGMYRTLLNELKLINPNVRLVGLTATPYRMTTGTICQEDNLFNAVCHETGVWELMKQGYLCKLINKGGKEDLDVSGLHVRGGEFIATEVEDLMNEDERVGAACTEIVEKTSDRKSVLVFCAGIAHAVKVAGKLYNHGSTDTIFGETSPENRASSIAAFKSGELKYLVNVNVLTTGFDAPNIDCVVLLKPTNSPGLFYQMCGRGFRIYPGKENCQILDFGGNILRHGPIDKIEIQDRLKMARGEAPWKKCPECGAICMAAARVCEQCQYEFPIPEKKHDVYASDEAILSGAISTVTHEIKETLYYLHEKVKDDGSVSCTLRVDYCSGFLHTTKSEWVCIEHDGYAQQKAYHWWTRRSKTPFPKSVDEALDLAEAGALAETRTITVRSISGQKYSEIVGHELGPRPEPVELAEKSKDVKDDDIPF